MGLFKSLADSADLVSGMADRTGTDLSAGILANPESGARAFAAMVYRCASCTEQDGCRHLQAGNDRLDQPPAYCRNRAALGFQDRE